MKANYLGRAAGLNQKIVTVTIVFLMVFATVLMPLATKAQDQAMSVRIIQITPSLASGPAGSSANLLGTIYTPNGSYQVFVGKTMVASGISAGYYIDANFTVPELPAATYALILRDVTINVNGTDQFTINTGYTLSATPSSAQEGASVTLNVAVVGGQLGSSYGANIAVTLPSGPTFTTTLNLGPVNVQGTASGHVTFPGSTFSPTVGATDYAGTYTVTFNGTLATSQFNIKILDSVTYHRGQIATIHATGYQSNQANTITITSSEGGIIDTIFVSANENGVINKNWIISDNVPIGEYTLKISPEGTQKLTQDQQTFTVVGYNVKVQVTNLSDRAVSGVIVQVVDSTTGISSNSTSDSKGLVTFKLEKGPHGLTAYLDGVNVGITNITVTGEGTFKLRCQLSDIKITVLTAGGIAMPFVNLDITYRYQSGSISRSGIASGQTDPSGSYTLISTLAGATYTIDASLYNQIFNPSNNTASSMSNQAITYVTIICPSINVTLDVTGHNDEAISGARIELVELSNGLFYSSTTDSTGKSVMQVTFGMYRVRVYKDNMLIKEASLAVFDETRQQFRCSLYGIQLSVYVVDLFGSPIPNTNVTLNGSAKISAVTLSNGIATFDNIIGGDMQIITQAQGVQIASQVITIHVNEPLTVQIKMDKYVSFGGILLRVSTLTTIIIILFAVLLFALVEVYRRRRIKSAKKSTT